MKSGLRHCLTQHASWYCYCLDPMNWSSQQQLNLQTPNVEYLYMLLQINYKLQKRRWRWPKAWHRHARETPMDKMFSYIYIKIIWLDLREHSSWKCTVCTGAMSKSLITRPRWHKIHPKEKQKGEWRERREKKKNSLLIVCYCFHLFFLIITFLVQGPSGYQPHCWMGYPGKIKNTLPYLILLSILGKKSRKKSKWWTWGNFLRGPV